MPYTDRKGRTHRSIIVKPKEQPIFIFGYGSLMDPRRISYTTRYRYQQKELQPCTLQNYERNMGGFFQGRNFYGILPNPNSRCNGVVFQIHDKGDYDALMNSEGATEGMIRACLNAYLPKIVTKDIIGAALPAKAKVIAVVLEEDRSFEGMVSPFYVELCHNAAKKFGKAFEKEFLATGGWEWNMKKFKKYREKQHAKFRAASRRS